MEEDKMNVFSERLKSLRLKFKLSQTALAQKIGKRQKTISRCETGKTVPLSKDLIILVKVFNCRVNYLLGLDDQINVM